MRVFERIDFLVILICASCTVAPPTEKLSVASEQEADSVINQYLRHGAWKYRMFSKEQRDHIDAGLEKHPNVAYLWQQRAMPLFKQKKYELGLEYLDKAVELEPEKWLDYRAFIKCIFAKTYREAIVDFEEAKKLLPGSYVMDHSFDFYIGLCHLQLEEFDEAKKHLSQSIKESEADNGREWVHFLDLFYFGIAQYELQEFKKAVDLFDEAIGIYPNFSDAKYYNSLCLEKLNELERSSTLLNEAVSDFEEGYTINEDNVIYEPYPYQLNSWIVDKIKLRQESQ